MGRALVVYSIRKVQGCKTRQAELGLRKGHSKRDSGGAPNRCKVVGLGYALLQFFVDVVQKLECRADSSILMNKARDLRKELLCDVSGRWDDSSLPKLVGNVGAKWFQRWRKKYGITKKVTGMKLKVAWRKIKI